ncbi:PD-(D/E)XK nuclease superfamily protein [bacterium A37T11]|nr:PD-(D/E)XK nuclease superfamily protein [bacterium A37T11]
MKNLPVGEQSFEKLRKGDFVYVDKTPYIHRLLTTSAGYIFLSRPRRFGKSLLLSTIKALFEGKKELFKGLYVEGKMDWEIYPVIVLDMTLNSESPHTLKTGLSRLLQTIAELNGVEIDDDPNSPSDMLGQLVRRLYIKTGKQVVVLVDEYDKAILDKIDDLDLANEMRKVLYTFYGALKASSDYLKLLVVTGITKISQTTIFSGFNNLNDISFDAQYAGICGYTQQELEAYFPDYIQATAQANDTTKAETLAEVKLWYNGYSWDAETFVYNPYSVLLLFDKSRYKPFWYSSGTPTFLLKLLKTKDTLEKVLKESIRVTETFTEGQRIESLNSLALLFQAGYLTIHAFDRKEGYYYLQIPNEEVRTAISELVLTDLTNEDLPALHDLGINMREAFAKGDTAAAMDNLDKLLSNITYDTQTTNKNEGFYHALFQLAMILANINHQSESHTGTGRTDSVLKFKDRVYVVEIKYAKTKEALSASVKEAMSQIEATGYAKPFLNQKKRIHKLAIAFTKGDIAFQEEVSN